MTTETTRRVKRGESAKCPWCHRSFKSERSVSIHVGKLHCDGCPVCFGGNGPVCSTCRYVLGVSV